MVVRGAPVISHVTHEVRPRRVAVAGWTDLTPRMRRVTLRGDVSDLPVAGPTDHAKVFFPVDGRLDEPVLGPRGLVAPPAGAPRPYREYTVREHRPAGGPRGLAELDVDFVRHGDGLASRWVEEPDGELWLLGPRTSAVVQPRDWYLLGGDETALPALGRWCAALPSGVPATVFVEVADAAEEQPLPSAADVTVHWLHRDGAAPGTTTLLGDAVAGWEPPAGDGVAWMGAEAGALRPVRRRLRDLLPSEVIDLDGYWRRGVEGTGLG